MTIVGDRPADMRAALELHGALRRRPDRHQRRAWADRRRPDREGRGRVLRARDGARRGARGADRADRGTADETLAAPRPRGDRAANRKQATIPRGATVLEPVGTAPGLVVPPAERGRQRPDRRRAAGPAARAAADVAAALATAAFARRSPARPSTASDTLRLFGIPESEIAETLRAGRARGRRTWRRSRSRPVCNAARSRSSTRFEPVAQPPMTPCWSLSSARHARRAVLARREDGRRAGRGAAERIAQRGGSAPHDRHCRVVHRRAAGRAADRAGRAPPITSGGIVAYSQ